MCEEIKKEVQDAELNLEELENIAGGKILKNAWKGTDTKIRFRCLGATSQI